VVLRDEQFLGSVANLASDGIEGVRIGVARFTATVYGKSTSARFVMSRADV